MTPHPPWLAIALALLLARLLGEAALRLRLPSVLGELLAGLLVGELGHALPAVAQLRGDPALSLLAELGAVILMFQVGLESDALALLRSGRAAIGTAGVGMSATALLVYWSATTLVHQTPLQAAFLATALAATSAGVAARILRDLGRVGSPQGKVILGAAVLDDILGLIALATIVGIAQSGPTSPWPIARLAASSLFLLGGGILLGRWVARHLLRFAAQTVGRTDTLAARSLAVALTLCLLASAAADAIGLAAIVGAFAAGLMLDPLYEETLRTPTTSIRQQVEALGSFLVPLFFFRVGLHSDLGALGGHGLLIALLLALVAVVGKLLAGLGAGPTEADRLAIGAGMVPRGEVTLIIAYQGSQLVAEGRPLIEPATFAAVVLVVLITTLLGTLLLQWRLQP